MGGLYLGGKLVTPVIEKEVAKTKFGASVDTFIGDVDENGVYVEPQETFELDLTKIKYAHSEISNDVNLIPYFMNGKKNLVGTIDLSNFEGANIDVAYYGRAFVSAFANTSINRVVLPRKLNDNTLYLNFDSAFSACSLESVEFLFADGDKIRLSGAFLSCTINEIKGLQNLQKIQSWGSVFESATLPEEMRFDSLTTIADNALVSMCKGSKGLKRIYFPALISIGKSSFGSLSGNSAFQNCTSITEIHFRADMQATIEAMSRYANKWGATNATIYFSL